MSSTGVPANISVFTGPLLLGFMFNWGLFGALTVQVYLYYLSFPRDRPSSKLLVFGLYTLECVQTIMVTHDAFAYFGSGWGNLVTLRRAEWLWLDVPVMSGIVSAMVQIFFAWRIYVLSKMPVLGIFVAMLAVMQGSAAVVQGVQALRIGDLSQLQDHAFKSAAVWLGGSALCDVIIASCMTFFLWRSNTGFRRTSVLLTRLIHLTIETGSISAAVATTDLIFFLVFRNNNFHAAPALTLAKFYSNNLLVIFNSRVRIMGGREDVQAEVTNDYNFLSRDGVGKDSHGTSHSTSTAFATLESGSAKSAWFGFSSSGNGKSSQGSMPTRIGTTPVRVHGTGVNRSNFNEYPLSTINVNVTRSTTTQRDPDVDSLPVGGVEGLKYDRDNWTTPSVESRE